jgi:5-methylcytosine-specific restriction endonuclease McrA
MTVATASRATAPTPSEQRMAGRKLQARRLRVWSASPHCAECGKLTDYPNGFDLDHKVALDNGGQDTDENCQVLCNGPDGCHVRKTARDMGYRSWRSGPCG